MSNSTFSVKRKVYRSIVKMINMKWLKNGRDAVWRDKLDIIETKPVWRVLYKPSLTRSW